MYDKVNIALFQACHVIFLILVGFTLNFRGLSTDLYILGDQGTVSRVGRKGGTKFFKYGWKSPWVPTLTELFPEIQADTGSWLGTKNALYYRAQSANHPRKHRGSQSGLEKRRNSSFQVRAKESLGTDSHQTISKIQADAGSWLGKKNALCHCAQSANSFSWVLFVSSYTTAIASPLLLGSFNKLVRAKETFIMIFYFPNQKGRNYRWVEKTFGML